MCICGASAAGALGSSDAAGSCMGESVKAKRRRTLVKKRQIQKTRAGLWWAFRVAYMSCTVCIKQKWTRNIKFTNNSINSENLFFMHVYNIILYIILFGLLGLNDSDGGKRVHKVNKWFYHMLTTSAMQAILVWPLHTVHLHCICCEHNFYLFLHTEGFVIFHANVTVFVDRVSTELITFPTDSKHQLEYTGARRHTFP